MRITEPTIVLTGNEHDIGITARPCATGFVSIALGMGADPIAFTPEIVAGEQAGLPGWRWRKEYLRDFTAQAGQPVFELEWLAEQRKRLRAPVQRYSYVIDPAKGAAYLNADRVGSVRVYVPADSTPGELPQARLVQRQCAMGIDVGEGVGQSDSTIQVFFVDNREQCCTFASNTITPTDLGRLAVAIAKMFNNALICCVRKMHGITTLRAIMDDAGYKHVWRSKIIDRTVEQAAKNYGWPGGEASSPYLFGKWVDAIQYNRVILHDLTTIEQHQQYIYDEMGRITHQALVDMPVEVRARHGDLVVACALAFRACLDQPRYGKLGKDAAPEVGSFDWFQLQKKRKRA